jgi:pimeloyl-ACP methyl ester carboxylesterase
LRKLTSIASGRDGSRIAWHVHAPGEADPVAKPALVLTNGIGTTENFWRGLVGALAGDHRVVHWDYRGHGSSGLSSSGDYSLPVQADDLGRVTQAVMASGDGQPPVHVAFSMGVTVALELYRRSPEKVRALVLIAGAPDAPGEGSLLFRVPGALAAARGALRALTPALPVFAPVMKSLLGSKASYPLGRALGILRKSAPRDDIAVMMQGMQQMDATAWWMTLRGLMEAKASDVLPFVKVPTLIIGCTHDVLMPRALIEAMQQQLPSSRYVQIEDAGHAALVEKSEEIAQAVRAFLDEIER